MIERYFAWMDDHFWAVIYGFLGGAVLIAEATELPFPFNVVLYVAGAALVAPLLRGAFGGV